MSNLIYGARRTSGVCPECGAGLVISETLSKGQFVACPDCSWDEFTEDEHDDD